MEREGSGYFILSSMVLRLADQDSDGPDLQRSQPGLLDRLDRRALDYCAMIGQCLREARIATRCHRSERVVATIDSAYLLGSTSMGTRPFSWKGTRKANRLASSEPECLSLPGGILCRASKTGKEAALPPRSFCTEVSAPKNS